MNYNQLYTSIIEKYGVVEKPKSGYYERHHIVPKCLGGLDEVENLVYVSARVHLLLHWILCKIHPKNVKLAHAFFSMCIVGDNNSFQQRIIPSLHVVAEARKIKSKTQSDYLRNNPQSQFLSDESKKKAKETAKQNGSYRGLNNAKGVPVDVYNYYTGENVAKSVSVTEWGRANDVKRNLNCTLYADRTKPSSSKNRHHAKGYYIILAGQDPYPPLGGNYPGPGKNYGHIGLKRNKP
jgi:hypothetical protein